MKLILASNNKAKLREFRRMFEGTEVELVSQREAGFDIEVEENGTSFEENSYIKAKAITDLSGCAAIADDSGIEVDCLGGALRRRTRGERRGEKQLHARKNGRQPRPHREIRLRRVLYAPER